MQRGDMVMMKLVMAAMVATSVSATAATVTWDSASTAGLQTTGGTWDLGSTTAWTTDGGATRGTWSSNGNVAEFQMPGSGTVTASDANGAVGTYGLIFSGTGASGTMYMVQGGATVLQLGAGGVTMHAGNQVVQTMNSGKTAFLPIALTASQTWSSTNLRTNSNGAGFRAFGNVSGTANLTFDGKGISDPYATGNTNNRVALLLGGANTYSGSATVTGGAVLWLDYTANSGSKLDDSSALILSGGSVVLNGGSAVVENVASTTVKAGGNTIWAGTNGGGGIVNRLALGALTHNVSGVLDVTTAQPGVASTTTQNTAGIIGGWATMGGGAWAVGSADGSATNLANTSGTQRNTSGTWSTATNLLVDSTASESGIGSQTITALRLRNASVSLSFTSGATLTLNSGGLIAASTGQSITGGKITTAAVTSGVGELFVHTPNAFTIGSEIANNGTTPTALVKAGLSSLTLTGASSYTGRTYVTGGSLVLASGGSLANGNITISAGSLAAGTGGGTINFNVAGGSSDAISISGGTLDLANLNASFAFAGPTLAEYVLVDKQAGSSSVLGTAFAGNNLNPAAWTIDYDGTAANPGSIVLVAIPEPATVGLFAAVAGLGLIRRRHAAK